MWFKKLTGFTEESPAQVRANITITDNQLSSKINGKTYTFGHLETPSLKELRSRSNRISPSFKGQLVLSELVADVSELHEQETNSGCLVQAASQFNLLEMVAPSVSPEAGVDIYERDFTQGPACAIAAGAGTIYRNYFASVNGQVGQTLDNQLDCLYDMGTALGNVDNRLWVMRNGYALASESGLTEINNRLQVMSEAELDALRETLRIGLQWDTQVTLVSSTHTLTQAYCSALPVAYTFHPDHLWAAFAQLVLEASYEATLHAALLNFAKTGNNKVYLTLLGGGAFGNNLTWILAAMRRAFGLFERVPLEMAVVSYGRSIPPVVALVEEINA